MVTRARVVRAYYEIRSLADVAASQAQGYRADGGCLTDNDSEAEFHTGRQCGMLAALNLLQGILDEDGERAN